MDNTVDVPITLKIRTGISPQKHNARNIALLAESIGIKVLAIHSRTRQCLYRGEVDYKTKKCKIFGGYASYCKKELGFY